MLKYNNIKDIHLMFPSSSFPRRRESSQGVCADEYFIVSDAYCVHYLDSRLRGNDRNI